MSVSREGTSGTATVSWSVKGGLPVPIGAEDLTALSGSVTLNTGHSVANIELEIQADDISETEEFMVLSLDSVLPNDTQILKPDANKVRANVFYFVIVVVVVIVIVVYLHRSNCSYRFLYAMCSVWLC